jgi:hypothetical protein
MAQDQSSRKAQKRKDLERAAARKGKRSWG